MKKYKEQIVALVMAFVMFCGVLIAPQTYKADTLVYDVPFSSSNTYFFYESGGSYAQLSTLSQSASYSLSTSITHFRVVQKLGFTLKEGDVVTISGLNLRYAIGTFDDSNSFAWFGVPQSNIYATNSMCSIKRGITYVSNTNSVLSGSFTITSDTSYIWFDFYLTSRSSTTVIQPYYGCSLKIERESDMSDVVGSLDSIDSKGDSLIDGILNLPSRFASALKSFFDNLGAYIDVGTEVLQTAFNEGWKALQDSLPSGMANALSGFFGSVETAINYVYDGVQGVIHGIDNLPSSIETFFGDLGDKLNTFNEDIMSNYFDVANGDKESIITGADSDISNLEEQAQDIKENGFVEYFDGYVFPTVDENTMDSVGSFMQTLFDIPFIKSVLVVCFSFATVGYLLYGKK